MKWNIIFWELFKIWTKRVSMYCKMLMCMFGKNGGIKSNSLSFLYEKLNSFKTRNSIKMSRGNFNWYANKLDILSEFKHIFKHRDGHLIQFDGFLNYLHLIWYQFYHLVSNPIQHIIPIQFNSFNLIKLIVRLDRFQSDPIGN